MWDQNRPLHSKVGGHLNTNKDSYQAETDHTHSLASTRLNERRRIIKRVIKCLFVMEMSEGKGMSAREECHQVLI
jgi:hypothetical protein